MHRPQLTIGMPVYNGARYIREALDSLLGQTFRDFEILISDNASTDATPEICEEYRRRDARIRLVRQSENRGLLSNFRAVLEDARGDLFTWAAADDVWDPRWLETVAEVASRHRCLAYGLLQLVNERGQPLPSPANRRRLEFTGGRLRRRLQYFLEPSFLGKYQAIYGIMPTDALRHTNPFDRESAVNGSDVLLLYDLLDRVEMRHGGAVHLYKRFHDEAAGAGGAARRLDHPRPLRRWIKLARHVVASTLLTRFLERSRGTERVAIVALFPVHAAWTLGAKLVWHLRRTSS